VVELRNASPALTDLIAFMGLTDVLSDRSGLEPVG
jgi:hypothetical protein